MRIGLVAMSGIRGYDAELLRLGLTLPGFVERSKTIASLPSLGLLTLAGMTPPEHECDYLEVEDIRAARPSPTASIWWPSPALGPDRRGLRSGRPVSGPPGVPVVLGGLHVTALPDEAARHADAVVVGEGELRLADRPRRRRSRPAQAPVSLRRRFRFADRRCRLSSCSIDQYNRLTVQASRGCPRHCEFCASSILLTARYKQKPAARVLAEIDRIRELVAASLPRIGGRQRVS